MSVRLVAPREYRCPNCCALKFAQWDDLLGSAPNPRDLLLRTLRRPGPHIGRFSGTLRGEFLTAEALRLLPIPYLANQKLDGRAAELFGDQLLAELTTADAWQTFHTLAATFEGSIGDLLTACAGIGA